MEAVWSSVLTGQKYIYKKKAEVKLNMVRKCNKEMGCGSSSQTLSNSASFQWRREFEAEGFSWIFESRKSHKSTTHSFFWNTFSFTLLTRCWNLNNFKYFQVNSCCAFKETHWTTLNYSFFICLWFGFFVHQRKCNEIWYSLSLLRSGICFFG